MAGFFVVNIMSVELLQHKNPSECVDIVTERIDEITVGRQILNVVSPLANWRPRDSVVELINILNRGDSRSETQRQKLRFSLNNNSANEYKGIEHKRAVSAYFTYNPEDETVIIEWGTINPETGDAKLHTYLNRMINFCDRTSKGMKLSSGHLAKIEGGLHIVLFDNLLYPHTQRINPKSPMGKIINTLYVSNNFVVVTANGYVQLPAF